jgi:hypothetical protein
MTTRKAIVLVNGLFQELLTPTDKLDFAGNTTTDLGEGTNLYYTDARSRSAISVTDSGGDGSLSYNNSTGVITYTGPSASEVRAHLSAAVSGTGFGSLSYDNSTGVFTYSVVTASNIRQQLSVTDSGGDGALSYDNSTGVITYTGPSASEVRAHFSVATGSGLTYNSTTGEFGTNAIPNAQLANSSITFGSTSVSLGSTVTSFSLTSVTTSSFLNVGGSQATNSITIEPSQIVFEGATVDDFETALRVIDPTADQVISLPNASGTVALLTSLSVAIGSGLTYNNTTGEFGTSNIPNSQLQNSSITIGSTSVALGSTATTITGLLSLTSDAIYVGSVGTANSLILDSSGITFEGSGVDAFETLLTVANATQDRTITLPDASGTILLDSSTLPSDFTDSTFRVSDNADSTKKLAFECSSISTGTVRTMTVPNESGTISTQDFATAIAVALG